MNTDSGIADIRLRAIAPHLSIENVIGI